MDKETLSNYGWIVICVLVLAVMIALAGPFGTFVAGAVKSTTAGLFGVNQNALSAAGIDIEDQAFANCDHLETEIRNATADYSGDTCCKECGTILSTGTYVIPEGGKYTAADGTVYNPGDGYPGVISTGDMYEYKNYRYKYNHSKVFALNSWTIDENQNGWGVECIKNVADPGPILQEINNEPIVNLDYTFATRSSLTNIPIIPDTVTSMDSTFYYCTSLADLSDLVIPESVTNMSWTFVGCKNLVTAPNIPSSVTNMMCTFYECYSLEGTITINTNYISNTKYQAEYGCCYCFKSVDMTNITLTGSASKDVLNLIGSTGNNWTPIP